MANEITIIASAGSIGTAKNGVEITIKGETTMPFRNHDLKVKAILSLLNDIDINDYHESNNTRDAAESYEKIIEAAKATFGID
ncbi:MAG: hypothetical protein RR588_00360 [Solibacillus sp.]